MTTTRLSTRSCPAAGSRATAQRRVSSRRAFLLPVPLGSLFRRLFLARLVELHEAGRLQFFGEQLGLGDRRAFQRHLVPVRKKRWVSTPSRRSPGRRPCSPTCRATRTASPSRTAGCSRSTMQASPSYTRITAATAPSATAP